MQKMVAVEAPAAEVFDKLENSGRKALEIQWWSRGLFIIWESVHTFAVRGKGLQAGSYNVGTDNDRINALSAVEKPADLEVVFYKKLFTSFLSYDNVVKKTI